jgi:hypothetical protein
MNKLMISLAAAVAIGAAVPAAAQSYGYNGGYGYNSGYQGSYQGGYDRYQGSYNRGPNMSGAQVNAREARLSALLQRAESRGQLSRYEVLNLRTELGRVEVIEKRYRWSGQGLTGRELAEVNARLDRVEQRLASISQYAPRYGDQRWNSRW